MGIKRELQPLGGLSQLAFKSPRLGLADCNYSSTLFLSLSIQRNLKQQREGGLKTNVAEQMRDGARRIAYIGPLR